MYTAASSHHACDIVLGVDTALGYYQPVCGNMRQQIQRCVETRIERVQVAVVDADQRASKIKRPVQFGPVVYLYQHIAGHLPCRLPQALRIWLSSSAATISRMASAPMARASTTW